MKTSSGTLKRSLEPLAVMLWVFFVVLSVAVGVVWGFGIGDAQVASSIGNKDLQITLLWLLRWLDFTWIMLGAINVYVCLAAREGLGPVRIWTMLVFIGVLVLVMASKMSGLPLGRVQYSVQLGPKIGVIPIGLPFLWLAVFGGAREAALKFFPKMSYGLVALIVGVFVMLTDASLEPLAAKLRGWWFWRAQMPGEPPGFAAPVYTPLVWGALAWVTTLRLREKSVVASSRPRLWKPVWVLVIFHTVFLVAHVGRWARG